jgi:ABC-type uncharacterized transport system substrate-binding protein
MRTVTSNPPAARWLVALLPALLALLFALPAKAHPHVWVSVRSEYVFTPDGMIAGIRHAWTFDDMYSAYAIQGLGKDGVPVDKGLAALAKVNVSQLAEYGYFTFLRIGGKKMTFAEAKEPSLTLNEKKVMTLHFTLMLREPVKARPAAVLKVVDPSYFVAFDFAKQNAVKLAGAPAGCSISMMRPKPLTAAQQKRLEAVQGTNESPGEGFGVFLATSAIAACP